MHRNEASGINDTKTRPKAPSLSHRLAGFLPFTESYMASVPDQDRPPTTHKPCSSKLGTLENSKGPLTLSTFDVRILNPASGDGIAQRQSVQLSSPCGSLYTRIMITVDMNSQLIVQSQVEELSPWAEEELGSWLRAIPIGTALETFGRAFSKYWASCLDRCQCWMEIDQRFSNLSDWKGHINDFHVPAEDESDERLRSIFGCSTCSLVRDAVVLRLIWLISLNQDGELDRHVSVCPEFPDSWLGTAIKDELDKVGEAFTILMKEDGIVQAMSMVANLIFTS